MEESKKIKPPTPEEFYENMLAIKKSCGNDTEKVHADFDNYICEVLRAYGFGKGVDVFEDTELWYA